MPGMIPGMMAGGGAPLTASPAAAATPNPGSAANALGKVRQAIELLQLALPELPMGSEVHKATTGAISSLSRHAPAGDAAPGTQMSALRDLAHSAMQQAPLIALMRAHGAAAAPGGAPAPMPHPTMPA